MEPLRERAFATFNGENAFTPVPASAFPFILTKGAKIIISQKFYTITEVVGSMVKFVNTKGVSSEISVQSLIDSLPLIDAVHGAKKSMAERLRTLGPTGLSEFLKRLSLVLPYLPGGKFFGKTPKSRSVRRYLRAYQEAKASFGIGEYGLIPGTEDRGNYNSIIPADVLDCMERFITKQYLRGDPRLPVKKIHIRLKKLLQRLRMTYIPSYRTVARHCKELDQNRRDLKRLGKRIAARTKVPFAGKSAMGSPHGIRPWETAHCDHTQNDVALDHPEAIKRLLKPWHSKMIDAVDGRALAWVTRLEGPCTETVIMLLNDCVRRHGTLPSLIVVDWGTDFRSAWLQKTLGLLGITLVYRPKASGVSGSPVETNNREIDQRFIHTLTGSTEIMKRAREVSANMLPNKHAIWTLTDLIEQYEKIYMTYNSAPDPVNKLSPNQMSENLSGYLGMHPRRCFHPEMLRRVLLPFVNGITRKVSSKCTFVVGRKTFASDELRHIRGQEVEVRGDESRSQCRPAPPSRMRLHRQRGWQRWRHRGRQ
jgi:transposase InsO family protein